LAPLTSLSLAGQEHGRTIPLTDLEAEAKPLLARLPGSYFNHSLRGTACRPGQSIVPV
jgi:hypothetical protein